MTAPYPVEALANTILARAEARGISVDPLKLQKLMYLVHGYYVGKMGVPLIDEGFESWPYGPVVPTIYREFKRFGSRAIDSGERAEKLNFADFEDEIEIDIPYIPDDDRFTSQILDYVFNTYGTKSGIYLSDLTHKVGSPWDITRSLKSYQRNATIGTPLIQEYFQKLWN